MLTVSLLSSLLGVLSLDLAHAHTVRPFVKQQSNNATEPILPYRDPDLCIDERVDDLLGRMSLEEKVGQMFHSRIAMVNNTWDAGSQEAIRTNFTTHFVFSSGVDDARAVATWYNEVQRFARSNGLGIPITISSDPQHAWTTDTNLGNSAKSFSRWPETVGLVALRSTQLVRQFAEIAREEYVSVGIRQALHPQVDLATEPRWGRNNAGMGEDASLVSTMVVEYINGFQGEKIGPNSVVTTTKHFPGGGPMEDGEDSHFFWGKNQTYPGNNREYHLLPFKAAIAAGTRQMMPYYSRPIGTTWEEVAFGFNKGVVQNLLKDQLGFKGIVVTDWGIVNSRPWGLENATELERTRRVIDAGCDIFGGGAAFGHVIVQLVREGKVTEARINESVRKLLREKYELGLFDKPFVDVDAAERVVGNPFFRRLGEEAQRRSFTLLTNQNNTLPLPQSARNARFYVEGIPADVLEARNISVVNSPEEADYAFLRLVSPFKPTNGTGLERFVNNGTIEYNSTEKVRQAEIYGAVPTIVDIKFNRPPAVPEIAEAAAALMGNYGASHDAFLDIVFGTDGWGPEGKLPFEIPRSQEAADAQFEDVPFDSVDPLFPYGHGLRYTTNKCGDACKTG